MMDITMDLVDYAATIDGMIKSIMAKGIDHCCLDQISRSSTSVMANFAESQRSQTPKDCGYKIGIASKEAYETLSWLHFMGTIGLIDKESCDSLVHSTFNIIKVLDTLVIETMENDAPTEWMKKLKRVRGE